MDHIFRKQLGDYLLLYLDDLIILILYLLYLFIIYYLLYFIYSNTLAEDLQHLRKLFQILRDAKLKLKGEKC